MPTTLSLSLSHSLCLSLLLIVFQFAHSRNLFGDPGREKTYTTITENCIKTCIAILTQDCLNGQTNKPMAGLLMGS